MMNLVIKMQSGKFNEPAFTPRKKSERFVWKEIVMMMMVLVVGVVKNNHENFSEYLFLFQ